MRCSMNAHLGKLGITEGDVLGGSLEGADDVAQCAQALIDALGLFECLSCHLAAPDPL